MWYMDSQWRFGEAVLTGKENRRSVEVVLKGFVPKKEGV